MGLAMEMIAALAGGLSFLAWLAVRQQSPSSSAHLSCISLGQGGSVCSAADAGDPPAASSQSACQS